MKTVVAGREAGKTLWNTKSFDFAFQLSTDNRHVEELSTLAFVARVENVILPGPPGMVKNHLAVDLALNAPDTGMVVYCSALSHLIAEFFKKAQLQG